MGRYALLILPSPNRVYAGAATTLTAAELAAFGRSVPGGRIAGGVGGHDRRRALRHVRGRRAVAAGTRRCWPTCRRSTRCSRSSGAGRRAAAAGRRCGRLDRFDDDLLTILKYQGKTNEQFTKLLLNVTLLASAFARTMLDRRLAVLDPLCGRGTTLNQALMYGFDAAGVDLDARDVEAYAAFIQTWLKASGSSTRRSSRRCGATARWGRRLRRSFAATKDEYKAGDVQRLDVVNADTARGGRVLQAGVRSTWSSPMPPYGVQHGSRTAAEGPGRAARLDLLDLLRPRPGLGKAAAHRRRAAGSRGTRSSPGARRRPRSSPTPGSSRWTAGRTAASGTAWTRRSSGTSWSPASHSRGRACGGAGPRELPGRPAAR